MIATYRCCTPCRLRFIPAAAANLTSCPTCGEELGSLVGAERLVGFRLFDLGGARHDLPEALAVSLPLFDPGERYP